MSQTDVSTLATAVAGITIEGPGGGSGVAPTGKVDLTDTDVTRILPGEIDSAVGSQPQPEPEPEPEDGYRDDGGFTELIKTELEDHGIEVRVGTPGALFDADGYVDVPIMDGQATDTLVISVSGSVKFDATDEEGRAIFDALTLGKYVYIAASGFVSARQGSYKENADGDSVVTGKNTIKIDSLRLRKPEDLT